MNQQNPNLEFVRSIILSPQFQQDSEKKRETVIATILSSGQVSYDDVKTILQQVTAKPSIRKSISSGGSMRPGFEKLADINGMYNDKLIVYILGAGPVGLMTAIKLIDVYQDKIRVVLFEKRPVYTRERVLFLNNYVIHQLLPKQLLTNSKLTEFGCSFDDLPSVDLATCSPFETLEDVKRLAISTRVLEDSLKEILESSDYNKYSRFIIYDKIDKEYVEDLNQKFTPHVFVGADAGALSYTLYSEQFGVSEKVDYTPLQTYGLVVQFLPEENDTAIRHCCAKLPKRQNRYRVFRQQVKKYPKFNNAEDLTNNTPTNEFLAYYIAAQINEAERNQVVKELGDKTFVKDYIIGTNTSNGKYLDRLIYDASFLYNFDLTPGRKFNEISLFPINVRALPDWQYSKVIPINNKNIWFPYIGDSIMWFNFFSGGGVNAGFGMIEFMIEALVNHYSPAVKFVVPIVPVLEYSTGPRAVTPKPYLEKLLSPSQASSSPSEIFSDPNALADMVEIYKNGIHDDLFSGIHGQDDATEKGIERLLDLNNAFTYLNYSNLINECHGDPIAFNRLKRLQRESGIRIEEIDLDQEAEDGLSGVKENHIYPKADDRLCLMSYGGTGSLGSGF